MQGRVRNVIFIGIFSLAGGLLLNSLFFLLPDLIGTSPVPEKRFMFVSLVVILVHIFAGDFIFYWYHRAQHTFPYFWVIHELHHSDTELNVTTSLRTFFLERPLQFCIINFPLIYIVSAVPTLTLFTLTPQEGFVLYVMSTMWLFFVHANIRLELGRLSWLCTGPQMHRIHHSIHAEHQDKNFAQFFPILDILFGTYHKPRKNEFPNTGTPAMPSRVTFREALLKPFAVWMGR